VAQAQPGNPKTDSVFHTSSTPALIDFRAGEGKIAINAYADFGYTFGPQRGNRYYDYIRKDTVEDFGRRDFTSYPLYANQFALAYSYLQAQYELKDKFRLRLALQAGHIVESLYNEEMNSLRYIREAAVMYFFTPKLALEAGIFPSYYGAEIVLMKENFHATRAYIADFTPDYEAGARLHYYINPYNTLRFEVLNGWQEIKEANGRKALGFVWSINKPGRMVGDFNFYYGNEAPLGANYRLNRVYLNAYYRLWLSKRVVVYPMMDWIVQDRIAGTNGSRRDAGTDQVVSPAVSVRYALAKRVGVAAHYDYVWNPSDVVPELRTNSPNGWQSHSYTLTLEYAPSPHVVFRAEGRYGYNRDAVFRNSANEPTRLDYYGLLSAALHF
jgi:Putative beta-barrel porin-2, OmpL-like. bbp2